MDRVCVLFIYKFFYFASFSNGIINNEFSFALVPEVFLIKSRNIIKNFREDNWFQNFESRARETQILCA